MANTIPAELRGQKYLRLTTFRKNGVAVPTPVWFAEDGGKIYVMPRSDSGKYKRIRNNSEVRVAPSTIRGRVTGQEFPGHAAILSPDQWEHARRAIRAKYWMARIPFLWSKNNVYVEITT
ncbi:MAG TPA: PPOX class F420-dependent oxidoreductase [Terriglobales bacterium]|nr:PPOX class F420-dependent oxidoreductase [Terriglobales bacterium]